MNVAPQSNPNAAEFAWKSDDIFGRIASRYDLLCDVFSFGIHRLWKRRPGASPASPGRCCWTALPEPATSSCGC